MAINDRHRNNRLQLDEVLQKAGGEMTENVLRDLFEDSYSHGGKYPKAVEKDNGQYRLLCTAAAWIQWKNCAMAITRHNDD